MPDLESIGMRSTIMGCMRRLWACGLWLLALPAFAWVYPEHRDIAVLGVQVLDPQRAAAFDKLWKEARVGLNQV